MNANDGTLHMAPDSGVDSQTVLKLNFDMFLFVTTKTYTKFKDLKTSESNFVKPNHVRHSTLNKKNKKTGHPSPISSKVTKFKKNAHELRTSSILKSIETK